MNFLMRYIRWIVFSIALGVAITIYAYVAKRIPEPELRVLELDQYYALAAITFLYVALLISPLYATFTNLPGRALLVRSRRAIGVSAFFFAATHAYISFFKLLGGFAGLPFLTKNYLIAISLSFIALIILSLMAATSFDFAVRKLGRNWKRLHRLVYIASLFIVIHALMLGSHFSDITKAIPQIFFAALLILILLEAVRFDKTLRMRYPSMQVFSPIFVICAAIVTSIGILIFVPQSTIVQLGIHSEHIKLAEEVQQQSQTNLPGMMGDETKIDQSVSGLPKHFYHYIGVGIITIAFLALLLVDRYRGRRIVR